MRELIMRATTTALALSALLVIAVTQACGDETGVGGGSTSTSGSGGAQGGAGGGGGLGGVGGAGGGCLGGAGGGTACMGCFGPLDAAGCEQQFSDCKAIASCADWLSCVEGCGAADNTVACYQDCDQQHLQSNSTNQNLKSCACKSCAADCTSLCPCGG